MAIKTFTVASYEVNLSRQMTIGGGAAKFYANILCRSSDGYRFSIYFLRPDSNEIDNIYNPTAKWATSYVPADQFGWYLDLLRNEKPVYVYLNSETPIGNRLYTGAEAVGEGED